MCTKIKETNGKINLLALETATNVASVAVFHNMKLVSEIIIDHNLTHSKTLLPNIEKALKDSGLEFKDLDAIACDVGPGSFTGIRIGLATAKGLCQAFNLPLIPVTSLSALAYNILYSKGILYPIVDARRNQVYTAQFRSDGLGELIRIKEDQPLDITKIPEWLNFEDETVYLIGDGVEKYSNELDLKSNTVRVAPYLCTSKASSVGAYALDHLEDGRDYKTVEPVYLRPSYAEEKKK